MVTVEKVLYCNDADHRTMRESWTVIFTTRSEFEADAVYRNLEYAGIKARVFTMREHVAVFWFDEFAIVRVLVRQDDRERALSILSELQLIHDSEDE
ncbi:MAG: DUF2007 domain-containing protein [Ignavibacteriales bacterium]|nr:DUF2007 domain-containing protein [Ignavibacteriales bacterium]